MNSLSGVGYGIEPKRVAGCGIEKPYANEYMKYHIFELQRKI